MADDKNLRKQIDHCLAEEAVDDEDHITVWALGGFVPDDPDEVEPFLAKNPPYRPSFAAPGTKVRPMVKARMENEWRLSLVEKANVFLDILRDGSCVVRRACKISGLNRTAAEALRQRCPTFAKLWDNAVEDVTDSLEEAGLMRAIEGVEKPVWYKGECVGYERVYSDSILTMMLAGRRSQVYKPRSATELSGPDGAPIQQANLAAEEFKAIAKDLLKDI